MVFVTFCLTCFELVYWMFMKTELKRTPHTHDFDVHFWKIWISLSTSQETFQETSIKKYKTLHLLSYVDVLLWRLV